MGTTVPFTTMTAFPRPIVKTPSSAGLISAGAPCGAGSFSAALPVVSPVPEGVVLVPELAGLSVLLGGVLSFPPPQAVRVNNITAASRNAIIFSC